jgi:TetR/AcrR family transcriptional regulator, lmrAB and yxaGH operons repressor
MKTKERFLAAGGKLFRIHGYSGTGLKQVVVESGAPWGSMYHFFPDGKEQLGAEAVMHSGAIDNQRMRAEFARRSDPAAAVRAIFKAEIRRLEASGFLDGCTVASVAGDVAVSAERVREACSAIFADWEATIADAFEQAGLSRVRARAVASFVLSALEGATLLSRTHRSVKPMRQTMDLVDAAVRTALAVTAEA